MLRLSCVLFLLELALSQAPNASLFQNPSCAEWLDCKSCMDGQCFWGQDKKCVALDATNNQAIVPCPLPPPDCSLFSACQNCVESHCYWGPDQKCVVLDDSNRMFASPCSLPPISTTPDCGQWLDCKNCQDSHCFWGQDKKCVALAATNNQSIVPCPPPSIDCSLFPACQSCIESHCYWGVDQKCVALDDSNRNLASRCPPPLPDCTTFSDCKTCGDANCFWGADGKCTFLTADQAITTCPVPPDCTQFYDCGSCQDANCFWGQGKCIPLGSNTRGPCPPLAVIKKALTCKPACKVNQQCVNGKCVAKPTQQPKKGDCLLQEGGKANKKAKKAGKNSAMPFIRNGDRYLNPLTCGTLFCHNGSLGLLDCPTVRCANGNEKQCDPNNKCQPKPCVDTPVNRDCPAASGIPLIKHGASYRDNQCKTHFCNNGLVTIQECAIRLCSDNSTKLCDANNNCQPGVCTVVQQPVQKGPYGCLAQGSYPALAHGETWRDNTSCTSFRCDNGTRIQTPCLATLCSNGEIKPCDPANNCQPAACGLDCPASGKFPNLLHNQRYLDAKTCTTYSCDNRVVTSEPCLAAICADGQLQPCDPNNRCQPAPCSSGQQISPTVNVTVGLVLLNFTTGLADCPAVGPVPLLRHGGRFVDRSTCTVHTCINGVLANEGMCLRRLCPGGLLPGCDPNRACLPKPCPQQG